MNRQRFKSSACNRGILDNWTGGRVTCIRQYPHGTPAHPRLVAALCPMHTRLTSADHDTLTWSQVAPLCKG